MGEAASETRSRWQLGLGVLALGLVLLAAFPYFEQLRNANELPRLVQSMALVEHGEWAIDGPSRRGLALGPDVARSPVDGRVYPNKPPGASVVGALAYVVARLGQAPPTLRRLTWWARLLAGVVPILIMAAVSWRRLASRCGPAVASAAVACVVLATPLFAYARLFYGHALAACLLYLGVVAIEVGVRERRAIALALGALAAAAAITVEYGAAFAGLPIAVMLLVPVLRRGQTQAARVQALRQAGIGLGAALIPVAALAAYQRAVFGSPWSTGYHHAADPSFAALHGQGLLGLGAPRWANVVTHWLSPNTGLLVWSPVVVVGVVGLVRLATRADPLQHAARLQLAVFSVIAFMGLGLSFEGGWRVGPRYLVVALPMLGLGVAEVLAWLRELGVERARAALAGAGLVGLAAGWSLVANALAATLWPHVDPTNIGEPFGAVLLPLWRHGFAPYGLPARFKGGVTLCLLAPLGLGLGALAWALRGAGRWAPVAALLGAIIGGAAPCAGIPAAVPPHAKTERNLRYIERIYEPARVDPARDQSVDQPAEPPGDQSVERSGGPERVDGASVRLGPT